jgi:long-chain acyl-CoA synthetase
VDLCVVDEAGDEVPRGTVGEVIVRSPGVMEGYWEQPELTAAAVREGWMHTGDAGYLNEDGYLFVVDRVKDMIITGGENVYSAEVENAVYKHSAVQECAVIGLPDAKWGEIVCAVVRRANGEKVTPEEVIAHCETFIAPFKCPKRVFFVDEPLPKTGAGKIQKTEIRKRLAGGD